MHATPPLLDNPKGPCTHRTYTLAKVYTIWAHGSLGQANSLPVILYIYIYIHIHIHVYVYLYIYIYTYNIILY